MLTALVGAVAVFAAIGAVILLGAFAGSATEYVAVEQAWPRLHAVAPVVAAVAGTVLSVPMNWSFVAYGGGEWSVLGWAIGGVMAAATQQWWFTSGYARGRLLKTEYGDDWVNHIGEQPVDAIGSEVES